LIGDLVDLARGDEPAQTQEDVSLEDIVLHEVDRARANHKGVDFDLDVEQVVVTGVPSRIARAVSNLLDNACKWSPVGSKITVRVRDKEVTVRDAGPGIAEQDLPYVFDRFYRAPAARQLPGSGLGLSIVRQTMQAHGGTAIAENHPDGGAVLTLRFP
jgi:two-component system sensor histidine kinase MprB